MQNLKKVRTKHIESGYDSKHFERDYWLGDHLKKANTRRAYRNFDSVIGYFRGLFNKIKESTPDFDIENQTILDVGAGAGASISQFCKAGFTIEGCEFSKSGRDIAKEIYDIDLDSCDLRKRLPYNDNSFDWVMCTGLLSMIPKKDMKTAISELLRISTCGMLIYTGLIIANSCNLHHLTAMTEEEYDSIIQEIGGYDRTNQFPPQAKPYGIGTQKGKDYVRLILKSDRFLNKL